MLKKHSTLFSTELLLDVFFDVLFLQITLKPHHNNDYGVHISVTIE